MKRTYRYLIAAAVVVVVLAAAFFAGGPLTDDQPPEVPADQLTQLPQEGQEQGPKQEQKTEPVSTEPTQSAQPEADAPATDTPQEPAAPQTPADTQPEPETQTPAETGPSAMELDPETGQDRYHTDPVPEGKPAPVEPEDAQVTENTWTCTISISCATILDNLEDLDPEKVELVPEDGWLLEATTVSFQEGESVFDVLQRVCREEKLHMEFMDTPMYNSAYIEGIGNLYEFDCGSLSGWMYCVNEWFPNYGCSRYALQDGDVIRWVYTCDLGADVGDNSMAG